MTGDLKMQTEFVYYFEGKEQHRHEGASTDSDHEFLADKIVRIDRTYQAVTTWDQVHSEETVVKNRFGPVSSTDPTARADHRPVNVLWCLDVPYICKQYFLDFDTAKAYIERINKQPIEFVSDEVYSGNPDGLKGFRSTGSLIVTIGEVPIEDVFSK